MRSIVRIFIVVALMSAIPSFAANNYRAGYELTLNIDQGSFQIRTRSTFSKEKPIQHDFGSYLVLMTLTETSESGYWMTIVVRESGSDSMRSDVLEHKLEGSYSSTVEFSSEYGSAKIEGAIAVSPLR